MVLICSSDPAEYHSLERSIVLLESGIDFAEIGYLFDGAAVVATDSILDLRYQVNFRRLLRPYFVPIVFILLLGVVLLDLANLGEFAKGRRRFPWYQLR